MMNEQSEMDDNRNCEQTNLLLLIFIAPTPLNSTSFLSARLDFARESLKHTKSADCDVIVETNPNPNLSEFCFSFFLYGNLQ